MAQPAFNVDLGPQILEEIARRVDDTVFRTWFEGLEILPRRGGRLQVVVPTGFHSTYLADRYYVLIAEAAATVIGESAPAVEFRVKSSANGLRQPSATTGSAAARTTTTAAVGLPLRPEFTFERFIPGPANRFPFAAAQAVSEHPGQQYNPLFLHGAVGLGKTHLLQSIARAFIERGLRRVVAISCAQFTDDFIASIADGNVEAFRERYRSADALLIDDIHFLEAKIRTQEEFFHTFNTLTNLGRQIVLTSDSPPAEIAGLGERLVSRFRRGLIAQLTPPELETRVAIVIRKGRDQGLEITPEIGELVAQRVRENVRELEGVVLRLHSMVHLERRPLDVENTRAALSELFGEVNPRIDLSQIQQAVLEEFDVTPTDLHSRKRTRSIVVPRQIGMYLARRFTSSSLGEIGLYFGGRDHTTVLHAVQKIEKQRESDVGLRRRLETIESGLLR
jgi:chromosomal replication initiator protein